MLAEIENDRNLSRTYADTEPKIRNTKNKLTNRKETTCKLTRLLALFGFCYWGSLKRFGDRIFLRFLCFFIT